LATAASKSISSAKDFFGCIFFLSFVARQPMDDDLLDSLSKLDLSSVASMQSMLEAIESKPSGQDRTLINKTDPTVTTPTAPAAGGDGSRFPVRAWGFLALMLKLQSGWVLQVSGGRCQRGFFSFVPPLPRTLPSFVRVSQRAARHVKLEGESNVFKDQGNELFRRKDYRAAAEKYQAGLKVFNRNVALHTNLAQVSLAACESVVVC
jgi:hypothetical protein